MKLDLRDYCIEEGEEIAIPVPETTSARQSRNPQKPGEPFIALPKRWLANRACDAVFDTRARLVIYLWERSRWGRRPVKFTSDMAQELGLERNKTRDLRRLAAMGVIAVEMSGRTPIVTFPAESVMHESGATGKACMHTDGAEMYTKGANSPI